MYVGNCMDEEASYTIDDPGGDYTLAPGKFRMHDEEVLTVGSTVTLHVNSEIEWSVKCANTLILFHKDGNNDYKIQELCG